jgi:hypothetical protein
MNPRKTTITILVTLSVSLALADDFKTINGTECKNATVSRVEPDGIVLKSKSGITKVYFTELPKEVQERFHYDAAQAAQFNATTQNAISEDNAAIAKQNAEAAEQRRRAEMEQRRQSEQLQAEMARQDRTTQQENEIVKLRKQVTTQQAQAAKASKRQRRGSDAEVRAANAQWAADHPH